MATGAVTALKLVRTRGTRKAFHVSMNEMMPTATSPGATSGRTMRKKDPVKPHPSRSAASTSSLGTFLRKPRMTQTTSGSRTAARSEEHTSELKSLMTSSYAFCGLKKKSMMCHAPELKVQRD